MLIHLLRESVTAARAEAFKNPRMKKVIGIIIGIILVLAATAAGAAAEIDTIALTGDITPVAGAPMSFATAPSDTNYTVVQIWMNADTNQGFTNSEEYNAMIASSLLPEAERVFAAKGTYAFAVIIIPNGEDVKFASDMNVSVAPYGNMDFVADDIFGGVMYQLALSPDSDHVHVMKNEYNSNNEKHWYECTSDDGYVFEFSKEGHEFEGTEGFCRYCGYHLSESERTTITKEPASPIEITCGDTLTLTVEANGRSLKYRWRWNKTGVFCNSDNFWNSGMKVTEDFKGTLTIENCNQNLERFLPIVCIVEGALGEATTEEINVTVNHNSDLCSPIDGTGHKVQCSCGKVIKETSPHLYSANVCISCGYVKGSTTTRAKEMTLSLPDFSDKNTPAQAKESATLVGTGIETDTNGIEKITFSAGISSVVGETKFDKDTTYKVRIYPDFEYGFYMDTDEAVYVSYNGTCTPITPSVDLKTRTTYLELSLKPLIKYMVTFDANGGSGVQKALYADEHNGVYLPVCTFTKDDDEFYAWEYNGKLYAEDPEENTSVYIQEDNAVIKAVWKSRRINNATVLMSYPENGQKAWTT